MSQLANRLIDKLANRQIGKLANWQIGKSTNQLINLFSYNSKQPSYSVVQRSLQGTKTLC